ncbi:unnamed protein product [Ixodes persulcatus]
MEAGGTGNPFADKYVRIGFIRKVYLILTVQMLITTGIIGAFMFTPGAKEFYLKHVYVFMGLSILGIVLVFVMSCFDSLRRSFPINFIILFAFVRPSIASTPEPLRYERIEIFIAVGITAVSFLVLRGLTRNGLSFQIDFTVYSGLAFVFCIVLCVAGLILLFVKIKILHLLYACGGTLLFSFYIVIDTQLIVGGDKRTFALSPEDYIAGALTLYLDVINVFLFILQILSVLREE